MAFGIAIAVPRHLQIMSVTLGFHLWTVPNISIVNARFHCNLYTKHMCKTCPGHNTFHRQAMLNKTTRILKPIAFRTRFHGEAIKMLWLKRGCYDLKRSQRFHAKTSPLQWLKTKCYDLTLPLVESAGHLSGPKKKMHRNQESSNTMRPVHQLAREKPTPGSVQSGIDGHGPNCYRCFQQYIHPLNPRAGFKHVAMIFFNIHAFLQKNTKKINAGETVPRKWNLAISSGVGFITPL